jgi:Mg2+ and Co2+ transporter CorA
LSDVKNNNIRVTGVTDAFNLLLDIIIEKSILGLEQLEEKIQRKELNIFKKKEDKRFLAKTNDLKEGLFFTSKLLRGDLEVIHEILKGDIPILNLKYFGEHMEDRILYLLDYIDLLKESVNNVNNLYVTALSNRLNKNLYRLAIIGALMVIPTIIAGLFGMNVSLPSLSFWQIIGVISGFTIVSLFILKLLF